MRTIRTEFARSFGRMWRTWWTWAWVAAFLSAAGAMFAFDLRASEGASGQIPVLWALSALVPLVCLAAFLGVGAAGGAVRPEGSRSHVGLGGGRFDLELCAPVLERDVVLGRFFAAFAVCALAVLAFWVAEWLLLPRSAHAGMFSFRPAVAGLLLMTALACSVGVLAGVAIPDKAVAVAAGVAVLAALPRAVFAAGCAWWPAFRESLADVPFQAHAADFAAGDVSTGTVAFYLFGTCFVLFAASKKLAMARLVGRGARGLRITTRIAVSLGAVFTALAVALAVRWNTTVALESFPEGGGVSARTRAILADGTGTVRMTAFLSRKSPSFPQVSRLMRRFEAAAKAAAGFDIHAAYLDPKWDTSGASRLARAGVKEGTVVFERGRRRSTVPARDADEKTFAGAIQSLTLPAGREVVYFIEGHGEASIEDYSPLSGLSDLARDLRRDGYGVKTLSLSDAETVPGDAACLVSCAAKEGFSRQERSLLEGYLREGGRLLVFADSSADGAAGLLAAHSLAPGASPTLPRKTGDGANIVAEMSQSHAVTRPLAGTRLLFGRDSATFEAARPEGPRTHVGSETTSLPLASAETASGGAVLAAAAETGRGHVRELAYRPMRIVAVGDASFAVNASIANRANSNRDFILNAIAWLSGLDASGESGTGSETVETGMDRAAWLRFGAWTCLAVPLVFVLAGVFASRRRAS